MVLDFKRQSFDISVPMTLFGISGGEIVLITVVGIAVLGARPHSGLISHRKQFKRHKLCIR